MIFNWLDVLDINVVIILVLMMAVAGFTMISGLLILILERTNMIGTLKAMGASNAGIQSIFLINAAHIILWGMLIGDALGLGICYLQQTFGIIRLPEESYYVSVAPVSIHYLDILIMNIATIVISLIFLIIPSRLVARIHPVKAIHFS